MGFQNSSLSISVSSLVMLAAARWHEEKQTDRQTNKQTPVKTSTPRDSHRRG